MNKKIKALREKFRIYNIDGYIVPKNDDYFTEYSKINMMTMHGSKGLEFDAVFLPGWEEGLFPHQKSIDEKGQKGLEEERR